MNLKDCMAWGFILEWDIFLLEIIQYLRVLGAPSPKTYKTRLDNAVGNILWEAILEVGGRVINWAESSLQCTALILNCVALLFGGLVLLLLIRWAGDSSFLDSYHFQAVLFWEVNNFWKGALMDGIYFGSFAVVPSYWNKPTLKSHCKHSRLLLLSRCLHEVVAVAGSCSLDRIPPTHQPEPPGKAVCKEEEAGTCDKYVRIGHVCVERRSKGKESIVSCKEIAPRSVESLKMLSESRSVEINGRLAIVSSWIKISSAGWCSRKLILCSRSRVDQIVCGSITCEACRCGLWQHLSGGFSRSHFLPAATGKSPSTFLLPPGLGRFGLQP